MTFLMGKWTRQRCQAESTTRRDGGLDPFMGVGGDQLDAAQAAPGQASGGTRSRAPPWLPRGRPPAAQHLAPAVGVVRPPRRSPPPRQYGRLGGPSRRSRRPTDRASPPSMGRARKAWTFSSISSTRRETLALGDAAHAHGLDQIVDRAGRRSPGRRPPGSHAVSASSASRRGSRKPGK